MPISDSSENPKMKIWQPLLFSLFLIGGIIIGLNLQKVPSTIVNIQSESNTAHQTKGKVEELLRYIEAKYVDKIDRDKLEEEAIEAILEKLDPHSSYISASQLEEVNNNLEGNFEGVGIEFAILEDTIFVVSPVEGGPSEKVGIEAGDKIIEIMDTIVAGIGIKNEDIIKKLKGEKGTDVTIGIKRGDDEELKDFTITRDEIPINSVDVGYLVNKNTGYIKINRFSATTYKEFMSKVETLSEAGMKDLIIDVRQNPGGYLGEATRILNQLIEERNEQLVYTEGRTTARNDYKTSGQIHYEIEDVAILVDQGSASASEILAGAVQDLDRGLTIGRRTFGKGLVQEQYELSDGAALRLTVAKYYTPSGRLIQKPYKDGEDYDADIDKRYESGELNSQDSLYNAQDTSKNYYTSKGRIVYGGGGIVPDVFVPLDTSYNKEFYQYVPNFVYRYVDKNREILETIDLKMFDKTFVVNESMYKDFINYAVKKGLEDKDALYQSKIKRLAKQRIKAFIARQLFKEEGFYTIWNKEDPIFQKAIELLTKNKSLVEILD